MKKVIIFFLIIVIPAVFFSRNFASSSNQKLLSPDVDKILGTNLWFPEGEVLASEEKAPEITAKGAYFVETNSGKILYQKNPRERLPIASLVKVITAITALENRKMSDTVLVSQRAAEMEPDHMELIAGETLTVEELLYGIFLVSANDAAEALAETTTGNRNKFIIQMNEIADRIGMKDTLFINPTGLQEDGRDQHSTAFDVAVMSRYAIKHFPQLVEISKTDHKILPQTETHQDYDLYSGINLLTTYPGVVGFKTGYTPEAGLTLVTLARVGGYEVLGVLLGSENRREEAKELLDYSFQKLGVK